MVPVILLSCGSPPTRSTPTDSAPDTRTVDVSYSLTTVGSLDDAVDLVERSASDDFFYVVSRRGIVEKWSRNGGATEVVLDISDETTTDSERGLLGLDFRRTSAGAWEAFASYTNLDGDTRIASFNVDADGTFAEGPRTVGTVIMSVDQPYANHNGGDIEVGPDNMLYVALGDGGSADDPDRRALDTADLLGKILRINPVTDGYVVPPDNPYVGVAGAAPEIWSIGLRNPWRITFDEAGNLWVADVGQNKWEEITVAPASDGITPGGRGVSFGWSAYEGSHRFNDDQEAPDALTPLWEYPHEDGACSVSGGAVGTPGTTPHREGWYFFGDYCSGRLTAIRPDASFGAVAAQENVADSLDSIVAVRPTSDAIYAISNGGRVSRIVVTAVSGARP